MDWLETLCLRPRVGALVVVTSAAFGWWQQTPVAGIFLAALVLLAFQWSMIWLKLLFAEMDLRGSPLDTEKDY